MTTYLPPAESLYKINDSWQCLTNIFGELTHSAHNDNALQNKQVLSSMDTLFEYDLQESFLDWYFDEIGSYLKEEIVEPFRNKSRNILRVHHAHLCRRRRRRRPHSHSQPSTTYASLSEVMMTFDTFDVDIWTQFLSDMSNIIEEVHREIAKIKSSICQLGALLTSLYSSKRGAASFSLRVSQIGHHHHHHAMQTASSHTADMHKQLRQRFNVLMDTIFLMDGCEEFETIFALLFEYACIHYSKNNNNDDDDDDPLVQRFVGLCRQLHTLRWLKILQSSFIRVAYTHIERELYRNYQSRKSKHFVDYSLFEQPLLQSFQQWVKRTVIQWLTLIIESAAAAMEDVDDRGDSDGGGGAGILLNVGDLGHKIEYFVYEKFGEMRTREMFDIILVYPQSNPALCDLKQCLHITAQWRPLQICMLSSFKKRLLHHGASSKDIITQYIATIGALKQLDPTGITLEIVGEPMRVYLRERDDAIRCVVAHLMQTDSGLLRQHNKSKLQHLHAQHSHETQESGAGGGSGGDAQRDGNESEDSIDSDLDGVDDAQQWQPEPLDAMFAKTSIFKRNSDTIGLLVKIFGSKEIFVDEYRKLLGDRLLARQRDFFDTKRETEYLELMKLRFGDESMQDCQVMVRDIENSKRDTLNIQAMMQQTLVRQSQSHSQSSTADVETVAQCLDATIISSQYWPQTNAADSLETTLPYKLPTSMAKLYGEFEETYAEIKKPRQIYWLPYHGCVELELEINAQLITLYTKPLQASLLMMVQQCVDEQKQGDDGGTAAYVSCECLRQRMGMADEEEEEQQIMPAISFWIKRGILKRVYDCDSHARTCIGYRMADGKEEEVYALQCLKKKNNANAMVTGDAEEDDTIMLKQNGGEEKEIIAAEFERTVLGVLTVFQGSSIERIMTRIKQMKLHPLYAKININQLQNVLDKLTNEKRVIFHDGEYKRTK